MPSKAEQQRTLGRTAAKTVLAGLEASGTILAKPSAPKILQTASAFQGVNLLFRLLVLPLKHKVFRLDYSRQKKSTKI